MGIIDLGSHTIFRCDRCRRWHIERYGSRSPADALDYKRVMIFKFR
jgi:hypothetical protein